MAPYEQKTDSREFETGGQRQSTLPPETARPTDIVVRLWGLQGYNRPGSLTWSSESVCVYMIADLVAASLGRIANESPNVLAAHFDTCGQALVAARRIQATILEFLSGSPGEAVGAAILIYQPTGAEAGLNAESLRAVLARARAGQILFAESLAQYWRDVPGIEFRAVPAMSGSGAEQMRLAELLWSTPEQGARLQRLVLEEPPAPAPAPEPEAPSMGATMMVNVPSLSPRRDEHSGPVAPPSTRDFAFSESSESSPQAPVPEARQRTGSIRVEPESTADAGDSLLQGLDEEKPFLTRGKILIGVVGVVLLAALITVLYWPVPQSKVRVPASEPTVPSTPSGKASVPQPTPEQPPAAKTEAPTPPSSADKSANVPQKTKPKPTTHPPNKPATETPAAEVKPPIVPPPPAAVDEVDGFTKKDIPSLLRMARKDVGDGRYDDARNEYRKILRLQPDNQDAKDGMQKLDRIKNDSDQ